MRKHGCAAGLVSSEPAISRVVTRDGETLHPDWLLVNRQKCQLLVSN